MASRVPTQHSGVPIALGRRLPVQGAKGVSRENVMLTCKLLTEIQARNKI
jgi:hypothetical protein